MDADRRGPRLRRGGSRPPGLYTLPEAGCRRGSVAATPRARRVGRPEGAILARACPTTGGRVMAPGRRVPSRWRRRTWRTGFWWARGGPEAPASCRCSPRTRSGGPGGRGGLVLARIPPEVAVVAVDAFDAPGEPTGRLGRPGVSEGEGCVRRGLDRWPTGATHGIGGHREGPLGARTGGRGVRGGLRAVAAALGAGRYGSGRPRVEPTSPTPAAPSAIVIAWTGAGGARVLLRQLPPCWRARTAAGAIAQCDLHRGHSRGSSGAPAS